MHYEWRNAEQTMIAGVDGNYTRIMEPGHRDWPSVSGRSDIAPYVPPTAEEVLAAERAAMICTPAQMRLALHRMGLLTQVQAIADADPEASIVWEYATQIVRTSPLIEALSGDFTPEQIDDIFRAAMAVET